MLPGELQSKYGSDPGYKNFLNWIAAGGKHGSYAGLMPNEAVVRTANTPWGENVAYDAAGNQVSMYRPPRPGEVSPYQNAGPSAPAYDPVASRNAFVPWAFTSKGIAGKPQPAGWNGYSSGGGPAPSLNAALGIPNYSTPPTQADLGVTWSNPNPASILAALAAPQEETELERQKRLAREAQLGVS